MPCFNEQDIAYSFSTQMDAASVSGGFFLPEGTIISQYFQAIQGEPYDARYSAKVEKPLGCKKQPFNVITRTVGNRPVLLQETLEALEAQTTDEFSMSIVCHNASREAIDGVLRLIENLPTSFSQRITVLSVQGGSRGVPLNAALNNVPCDYFTILDDDDLITTDWIESFRNSAETLPGAIVHSFAYSQKWENGAPPRALEDPEKTYFSRFNYRVQLSRNCCPIMSLAFPYYLWTIFHLSFDEELTTIEDWDFLLRASNICRVIETGKATSTYRLWQNAQTSYDLHKVEEWEKNFRLVRSRKTKSPLIMPSESIVDLVSSLQDRSASQIEETRVYASYHLPNGHEEKLACDYYEYDYKTGKSTVTFSTLSHTGRTRIYFGEEALFAVDDLMLTVSDGATNCITYGHYDIQTGGLIANDKTMVFINSYPWIEFDIPPEMKGATISLGFVYRSGIREDVLDGTKIGIRIRSKLKKIRRKK